MWMNTGNGGATSALRAGWLMAAAVLAQPSAWADDALPSTAELAATVLQRQLQQRHGLQRVELAALPSPAFDRLRQGRGEWTLTPADEPLRRRMSVLAERNGPHGRTERLRLDFDVHATVWGWRAVAARDTAQALDAGSVTREEIDAIRHPDALRSEAIEGYRVKHRLAEGQVVRQRDVVAGNTILQGESVDVVYRLGAITVRTRGRALQQAAVGQSLRLAVAGSPEAVVGVAAGPGTVDVTAHEELQ